MLAESFIIMNCRNLYKTMVNMNSRSNIIVYIGRISVFLEAEYE